MDSIVCAAIEEVCVRAAAGVLVTELWPSLRGVLSAAGLPPGDAVHKAIWVRFLGQQGIRFEARGSRLCAQDPSIQSLEEAERIEVRIVAEDHLRDSFLGIYDLKASTSEISQIQRAVLERLAAARTKGVTQSELAKEFGIKANSFFYIVRNLECQQLIVRQSTIVRAKETAAEGENAPKNISVVSTNLLLLRRYAKNLSLNSQQKFEITKGDSLEGMGHNSGSSSNVGESSADFAKGDLSVKDYLPAIKAICDKLEESCGKVLVVSDIKSSLGYRKSTGHRAWRSVLNRLKDAHLVEEFQGEVNKKVVSCLRLLKKFDSCDFLHKKGMNSHDSFGYENLTKIGKRGDITDEFVELPTDNCIYDMVDAEGERGLTIPEISIRLGFTSKKLHKQLSSMRERFGMCWPAEIHERTPVYRIWTFENYPLSCTWSAKFGACHQNFGRKTDNAHNFEEPSKNLCDGHKVTILDLPSDRVVVDLEGGQDNKSGSTLSDETMQVADSGQGKPVEETMQVSDADQGKPVDDKNNTIVSSTQICCPILPWINGDGSTNTIVYKGLTRRLFGTVMQNPGILEEDIIQQMDVLNPQSCRRLLELMILDSHLTVRKLPQTPSSAPVILQSIFGSRLSNGPLFRKHFFANPLSTTLL